MNSFGWLCRATRLRPSVPKRSLFIRFQSTSLAQDVAAPVVLPTAVVSRAQRLVAEQKELEQKLIEKYDLATAKKAGEMSHITEAYKTWEKASEVHPRPVHAEPRASLSDRSPRPSQSCKRSSATTKPTRNCANSPPKTCPAPSTSSTTPPTR